MDTLLKPAHLDLDPNSPSAAKEWKHWHRTFKTLSMNVVSMLQTSSELSSTLYHTMCTTISKTAAYDAAIEALAHLYIKTPNEIFARNLLATRRQKPGETSLKNFGSSASTAISKMLLLNNTLRNWSAIPSSTE